MKRAATPPDGVVAKQAVGRHLAQFNLGILRHDWDDPRVQDFVDGLDPVNEVARRSSGFVWMLGEEAMEAAQSEPTGALGGNPRTASTLSVWRDVASLENFVWNSVHKQYYARRAAWFDAGEDRRLVMWWVPKGHRPNIDEAVQRLAHLKEAGESGQAFGWSYLKEARLFRSRQCNATAAE